MVPIAGAQKTYVDAQDAIEALARSNGDTATLAAAEAYTDAATPSWTSLTGKPSTFPPTLPIAESGVSGLSSDLASLASQISSEATTRAAGDSSAISSAESYTDTKIAALINSAPGALDTLKELADAMGDDANFAASVTTSIAAEASARASADALKAATTYVDAQDAAEASARASAITTEASSRIAGDAATLATAEAYTDTQVAAEATARGTAVTAEASARATADGLLAPKASPALTGSPTAPTQTALDNSTKISTTAYSDAAVAVEATARAAADSTLTTAVAGKQAALGFTPENAANKDANSGYAGLDSGGKLKPAEFPAPTSSLFGGIKALAAAAKNYLTGIGTDGVPVAAQPQLSDLSDTPAANRVAASPDNASGALTARLLVPRDLPNANAVGSAAYSTSACEQSGAGNVQITTLNLAINRGDCVVVFAEDANSGFGSLANNFITDNGGNVYFPVFGASTFTSSVAAFGCFVCLNAAHAATKIMWQTASPAAPMQLAAATYTGIASIGTVAVTNSLGATTAGTISLTPGNTNSIMVAGFVWFKTGSVISVSANTGNLRTSLASAAASVQGIALVDNTQAGTGSESCSITASVAPTGWAVIAIELIHN